VEPRDHGKLIFNSGLDSRAVFGRRSLVRPALHGLGGLAQPEREPGRPGWAPDRLPHLSQLFAGQDHREDFPFRLHGWAAALAKVNFPTAQRLDIAGDPHPPLHLCRLPYPPSNQQQRDGNNAPRGFGPASGYP
jgi:hypothetical protein